MGSCWVEGIEDLNKLSRDLHTAGPRASRDIHNVLRAGAAKISRDAKSFAPVDTGHLKNSIGWDYTRASDTRSEAEIGPTADYGAYVEYGTSRQAPAAYMGPAFDRNAPGIEAALDAIAGGVLDE